MNFKQYQFLKATAIQRLKEHTLVEDYGEIEKMDSLALAYIGDSYYSTFVRAYVLRVGIQKSRILHDVVTAIICAKGQANSYVEIETILNDMERKVAKRARNSNVNVPKSANLREYRYSTSLEAIIGYLYLKNDFDRLHLLCEKSIEKAIEGL